MCCRYSYGQQRYVPSPTAETASRGTIRDTSRAQRGEDSATGGVLPRIAITGMDVTRDTSIAEGFANILAEAAVDVLTNNPGIMYLGMTEAHSVAQANGQMVARCLGAIRAMQALLPSMRAAGTGPRIATSCITGRVSAPFFDNYCATRRPLRHRRGAGRTRPIALEPARRRGPRNAPRPDGRRHHPGRR